MRQAWLVLLMLTTGLTAAGMDAPGIPIPDETPAARLRTQTDLVIVPVWVTDRDGRPALDLKQENFRLFEDEVPQPVAHFFPIESPFRVLVLADISASMRRCLKDVSTGLNLLRRQLRPGDSLEVLTFSEQVWVKQKMEKVGEIPGPDILISPRPPSPSGRTDTSVNELSGTKGAGLSSWDCWDEVRGTRLRDALETAVNRRLNKLEGRKALVVFTDGVDTCSARSVETLVELVRGSNVVVFPIRYDTAADNIKPASMEAGERKEDYERGRQFLDELAGVSGGRVFPAGSPRQLVEAFTAIATELGHHYGLGYYPVQQAEPPALREIRVEVDRPGLIVKHRQCATVRPESKHPCRTGRTPPLPRAAGQGR